MKGACEPRFHCINNPYYAGRLFFPHGTADTAAEKSAAAQRHVMSPVQQCSVLFSLALRNPLMGKYARFTYNYACSYVYKHEYAHKHIDYL
jgi:hypothetical protein